MNLTAQAAKHLRDVHFGGNWTTVNLKDTLADVSWQEATTKVADFNTIATLAYHITYYVSALLNVLQGGPLDAKDEYSFKHPPINSQEDWENLQNKAWADAESAAVLLEQLPESRLGEDFTDKKYGTYFRNIQGMTEHLHYHLGQIVILKKLLRNPWHKPVRRQCFALIRNSLCFIAIVRILSGFCPGYLFLFKF